MRSPSESFTRLVLAGAFMTATACGNGKEPGTQRVTVSNVVTYWSEDGSTREESSPAAIQGAIFSQGLGTAAQRDYPGARNPDGSWSVEIPRGPYWAKVTTADLGSGIRWYEVASGGVTLDLGGDQFTLRGGLAAPTPVTFEVSGLRPWIAGDELRIHGWNVGTVMTAAPALPPGAQAGSVTFDWKASWASLLQPADSLWVTQVRSAAASDGGTYRTVVSAKPVTGVSMTDGAPLSIPVAGMAEPAALGTLALDWRLSQFEAAAQVGVVADASTASVWSQPLPTYVIGPSVSLLELVPLASGDHDYGSLSYGRPLPPSWHEVAEVTWRGSVTRTIPGTSLSAALQVRVGRTDPVDTAPSPVVPCVGAVTSIRVAGRDAMVPVTGVGLTPTVAWDPPAVGVPTRYYLGLYELAVSGTQARTVLVTRVSTTGTAFTFPEGIILAGRTYLVQVTAIRNKEVVGSARAWRVSGPWGSASSWSDAIQP